MYVSLSDGFFDFASVLTTSVSNAFLSGLELIS